MTLPPISFATDTELRDEEFARKLRRRRRLMHMWSVPVVIIAAAVALKFLSAVGLNLIGTHSYDRANYATAAARYANTQFLNVVQPWKAHYNEGTAHYSAGKFFTAGTKFAEALEVVPKAPEGEPRGAEECMVRVNYSLALEGIGDETFALGDAVMAEEYYTRALDMLADCASSGAGGETAEDAQDRQEQSQEQAQGEQDPDDESQGEGDPEDGEGDPSEGDPAQGDPEEGEGEDGQGEEPEEVDPQQQELEERNQRANEAEGEGEEGGGVGDGSGQNW